MPYIPESGRELARLHPRTPGELNYAITALLIQYIGQRGASYTALQEAHGAATCAAAEFYRRACAPYEDQKAVDNGDVYKDLEFFLCPR